jgi:hypothetical protein
MMVDDNNNNNNNNNNKDKNISAADVLLNEELCIRCDVYD